MEIDYDKILRENSENEKQQFSLHIVINNTLEQEVGNSKINTIINSFTKSYSKSPVTSDIIQSGLEYNNFLIKKMIEMRSKISENEYELCTNILWNNLKNLSKHADKHVKSASLIKNNKYLQIYEKIITKRAKREKDNHSGLTTVFDKHILDEKKIKMHDIQDEYHEIMKIEEIEEKINL
jgi:hypothetical protein